MSLGYLAILSFFVMLVCIGDFMDYYVIFYSYLSYDKRRKILFDLWISILP